MARVEHIDWLETFVAVVDSGGFSAAAGAVHRSQSRVSAHVAALEQALGVTLFDRRHRPVGLTDAGEAYLPHAREVLAALDRGHAEIEAVVGVTRGSVVLGSYPSASAAFLPGLMRTFTRAYPRVRVDLTEQATVDLAESLNSGELHLALRALAPLDRTEGLLSRPLWCEPLVAVFPTDHPLSEQPEPLPLSVLSEHELVTIGGHLGQEVMYEAHTAFQECETPPHIAWQTDQPQTLANFVRAGLGVGVTNALAMRVSDTTGLEVVQVGTLEQGRTVGVFWDPQRYMPRAARVLLEEICRAPVPTGTTPAALPGPADTH
jgi:DNA-binding transcriptional LysR family regulator